MTVAVPNTVTTPAAPAAPAPAPDPNGDSPSLLSAAQAAVPGAVSDPPAGQPDPNGEKKVAPPAPEGAPEAYTDFNFGTLPAGMEIDQPMLDDFKTVSKELGLTQEKAQKLVTLTTKHAAAQYAAMEAGYQAQRKAWADESIKELGPQYQEQLALAAKFRDQIGSPELTALLNETGLANNIHVLKAFIRGGGVLGEDALVRGNKASGTLGATAEERHEMRIKREAEAANKTA